MVQNYNFFVKPQSKNQPFSKKTLKTADFCHCFCITDVFIWGHKCYFKLLTAGGGNTSGNTFRAYDSGKCPMTAYVVLGTFLPLYSRVSMG